MTQPASMSGAIQSYFNTLTFPETKNVFEYFSRWPNPLNSRMDVLPSALNTLSTLFKNLAFGKAALRVNQGSFSFRSPGFLFLSAKVLDAAHVALYLGKTGFEKVNLVVKGALMDFVRLGCLPLQGLMPIPSLIYAQPLLGVFQILQQAEDNFLHFNDDPSKNGNLYRAILSNDALATHNWSKHCLFLNEMGEGGALGTIPALFIAAQVSDVRFELVQALVKNGADPECVFVDPKRNFKEFTILGYLKEVLPKREDLHHLISDAIRDKKLREKKVASNYPLLEGNGAKQGPQEAPTKRKDEL